MKVAVYDTKPHDKEFFKSIIGADQISWIFYDFRLTKSTTDSAQGCTAVCLFVNDQADAPCLKDLASYGIKLILLRCTGFDQIDLKTAHQLGIHVTRVPSYSPHSVAEHAAGLLLALNRKIHLTHERVHQMNFSLEGLLGFDIHKKVVGIIGTKKIGKMFAKIMKGFGAKILLFDTRPSSHWAEEEHLHYVPLEELLEKSDIISLHLPLTLQTHYLIDEKALSKMKKGVLLINTSRGKILKTSALIESLESGHVAGAALDTYEKEAGVFFEDLSHTTLLDKELSALLKMPNVIITPHQGFFTIEAMREIARVTVENLIHFKHHRPFITGTELVGI